MATCKTCGKEFTTAKKRGKRPMYCSYECYCKTENQRKAARRREAKLKTPNLPVELTCPVCGEKFIKKTGNQKYCCGQCQRKHEHDKIKAYNKEYHQSHANAPRSHELINKGITPFSEIIAQSTALGLSYGQLEDMKHRGVL